MKRNAATGRIHKSALPQKNFSLIELLIVIAVIAILAAMLFPALNAAKRKAQAITCASQLKTVIASAHLYANSYYDIIPRTLPVGASGDYHGWLRYFATPEPEYPSPLNFRYSEKYFPFKVLRCPENLVFPLTNVSQYVFYGVYGMYNPRFGNTVDALSDNFIASYGNCYIRENGGTPSFFSVNRMKNSSALPLFADTVVGLPSQTGYRSGYWMFWASESGGFSSGIGLARQHPGGRCPMAFADGHVSPLDANGLAKLPVSFRHSWGEGLKQTVLSAETD